MKFSKMEKLNVKAQSPSMRREWIEIYIWKYVEIFVLSPSMRREWIEMQSL